MEGQSLSHYKVLERLGGGGMGVVYRAIDTRLDRNVALKFLPPDLTRDDDARERFVREAKAASALDHPNICTIYEIDETAEGQLFIAMGYYEGETLKKRIARGALPIDEAVDVAILIAQGLAKAHASGIVHRDIKPANVMITSDGLVKIVDFGIAKLLGEAGPTRTGRTPGTVAYMSPEQISGGDVDQRTDLWSLGAVLYEMLTGRQPFRASNEWALMSAISDRDPDLPALLRTGLPKGVEEIVLCALEKKRDRRYETANEFLANAKPLQAELKRPALRQVRIASPWATLVRPRVAIPMLGVVVLITAFGVWSTRTAAEARRFADETLPEIRRLIEDDRYAEAFRLAEEVERVAPQASSMLADTWPDMSLDVSIETRPPGARVIFRDYLSPDREWRDLGPSPITGRRVALGRSVWTIRADGYADRTLVLNNPDPLLGNSNRPPQVIVLEEDDAVPADMVSVDAANIGLGLTGFPPFDGRPSPRYLIDTYEVTNRDFQAFVDAGGYERQESWTEPFEREGRILTFEEATADFRDQTGQPGPSTWAVGTYPEGAADLPVTGVSWYEAMAYAEFADKALPTLYHWVWAAGIDYAPSLAQVSNINGTALSRVGEHPGIGFFGTYDMAGNAREWVWNESAQGTDRYILGGAWNEPDYQIGFPQALSPWDRTDTNGFRLVAYPDGVPDDFFFEPIEFATRDYTQERPVSPEVFSAYADFYFYDPAVLESTVEFTVDTAQHWIVEKVSFNAAYGDERVPAYLFLPKNSEPPYQTLLFFPGSGALRVPDSRDGASLQLQIHDFLMMSGRAVVVPIYKGTYERQTERGTDWGDMTSEYRDRVIQQVNDARRTIDYLATRDDIDMDRLGYYGFSWGGQLGSIVLALEPRLKLATFLVAGLWAAQPRPEVDPFNFAPRVTVPVLTINGEDDFIFPLESAQQALVETLRIGSSEVRPILFPGGHSLINERRNQVIGVALEWLDEHFGPVN